MSEETRRAILQAGLEHFALIGFDATSTRAIAKSANANLSAISYHFGGKEGLYKAVLQSCFQSLLTILDSAPTEPKARLTYCATHLAKLHQEKPLILEIALQNMIEHKDFMQEELHANQQILMKFFAQIFEAGKQSGQFRQNLDTKSATIAFAGIIHFYFITNKPDSFALEPMHYIKYALEVFFHGIEDR